MKRLLTTVLPLVFAVLTFVDGNAQKDLFKGIFEREDAKFHPTLENTPMKGVANLNLYFTHSKVNALEYSVWIKDLGTSLVGDGPKKMVKDLGSIGNREKQSIKIDGLVDGHFYTIGLDYRRPQSLNRKFISKVLQEGYVYRFQAEGALAKKDPNSAPSPTPSTSPPPSQNLPCYNPNISVQVEASGYCGTANRPAILVQCKDCQGKNWRFSVEVKTKYGQWQSLRADGEPQNALGVAVRTEPLCLLRPGMYDVQVLAWGQNCATPIVKAVQTAVIIPDDRLINNPPVVSAPSTQVPVEEEYRKLPDTCEVSASATVQGSIIRGTVELNRTSPCGDMMPYAVVKYVHPGYRDITLDKVVLIPGSIVPFEFPLDARDMQRGIHTIQVQTYVKSDVTQEEVPMSSFWVKAELPGQRDRDYLAARNGSAIPQPAETSPKTPRYTDAELQAGERDPYESSVDATLMEETFNTVNVTASDPNCTPIQDLNLVFDGPRSTIPLYIAWLNPRCCQEEGCDYTVWAGAGPKQLRLLVSGRKKGAMIRELLTQLHPDDQYYEVVVKTGNGQRKAAYVSGTGPLYGVEDIIAYHDEVNPTTIEQPDDGFTSVQVVPEGAVGGALASRAPGAVPKTGSKPLYDTPSAPITKFEACKYKRDLVVRAEQPIQVGDIVDISYGFKAKGYQYTLYFQPKGSSQWVIAPGTKEGQSSPDFELEMTKYHTGKYLLLSQKESSNWGCLSSSHNEAVELNVIE
ncbi:MAG: hypothetical protein F6K19_20080 [Cyanothece sp. SIO1E1]|nr:hypothetical protein [Cyanothece sp. SIO1E1]